MLCLLCFSTQYTQVVFKVNCIDLFTCLLYESHVLCCVLNALHSPLLCTRATTYYLADRRYDMLPAVLSGDLCSLLGGVDRSALSYLSYCECVIVR